MNSEKTTCRILVGDFGPRVPEEVPEEELEMSARLELEDLEFLAKAALTNTFPAMTFAWVMSSPVLFACSIVVQMLGVVCGLLLYKPPPPLPLVCVPVHENPTVPAQEMRKAA